MPRPRALDDIRLADLATLAAVHRRGSISAAARETGVSPSQVSKAIARVEKSVRARLLARTPHGVDFTDAGRRIMPHVDEILHRARLLRESSGEARHEITLVGPSYLITQLLAGVAKGLPRTRLRALEMPPSIIRASAADNLFDVALLLGGEPMPRAWVSVAAGVVRKCLLASPALAERLGPQPVDPATLRTIPFVCPVYAANGKLVASDDGCPLPRDERKVGHEVETIAMALELAAQTDQLVFGPRIAAAGLLRTGTLVEVAVKEWSLSDPLWVASNGESVMAASQRAVVSAVRRALSAWQT